jgi:ZIP family zinc transporter
MLPSAKKYLEKGGQSPKLATFTMMGCFLVGALAISVLSQILHRYIPHSVVDCDHEHGDEEDGNVKDEELDHAHPPMQEQSNGLAQVDGHHEGHTHHSYGTTTDHTDAPAPVRPSLHTAISSRVSQLVAGSKSRRNHATRTALALATPTPAEQNASRTPSPHGLPASTPPNPPAS